MVLALNDINSSSSPKVEGLVKFQRVIKEKPELLQEEKPVQLEVLRRAFPGLENEEIPVQEEVLNRAISKIPNPTVSQDMIDKANNQSNINAAVNTVGDLGIGFTRGVMGLPAGIENLMAMPLDFHASLQESLGLKSPISEALKGGANFLNTNADQSRQAINEYLPFGNQVSLQDFMNKPDLGKGLQLGSQISSESAGSFLPAIGLGAKLGTLGNVLGAAGIEATNKYAELNKNNVSGLKSVPASLLYGGTAGFIESKLGDLPVLNALMHGHSNAKTVKDVIGNVVKTVGGEGLEEGLQQTAGNITNKAVGLNTPLFKDVPSSVVGGLIGGVGPAGMQSVIDSKSIFKKKEQSPIEKDLNVTSSDPATLDVSAQIVDSSKGNKITRPDGSTPSTLREASNLAAINGYNGNIEKINNEYFLKLPDNEEINLDSASETTTSNNSRTNEYGHIIVDTPAITAKQARKDATKQGYNARKLDYDAINQEWVINPDLKAAINDKTLNNKVFGNEELEIKSKQTDLLSNTKLKDQYGNIETLTKQEASRRSKLLDATKWLYNQVTGKNLTDMQLLKRLQNDIKTGNLSKDQEKSFDDISMQDFRQHFDDEVAQMLGITDTEGFIPGNEIIDKILEANKSFDEVWRDKNFTHILDEDSLVANEVYNDIMKGFNPYSLVKANKNKDVSKQFATDEISRQYDNAFERLESLKEQNLINNDIYNKVINDIGDVFNKATKDIALSDETITESSQIKNQPQIQPKPGNIFEDNMPLMPEAYNDIFNGEDKTNLSEQQSKDLQAKKQEIKDKQNSVKNNESLSEQEKGKVSKGIGFKGAAKKRKIIQGNSLEEVEGGLTAKELEAAKNKVVGKEILLPDGTKGIITSNTFSKLQIKTDNGIIDLKVTRNHLDNVDLNTVKLNDTGIKNNPQFSKKQDVIDNTVKEQSKQEHQQEEQPQSKQESTKINLKPINPGTMVSNPVQASKNNQLKTTRGNSFTLNAEQEANLKAVQDSKLFKDIDQNIKDNMEIMVQEYNAKEKRLDETLKLFRPLGFQVSKKGDLSVFGFRVAYEGSKMQTDKNGNIIYNPVTYRIDRMGGNFKPVRSNQKVSFDKTVYIDDRTGEVIPSDKYGNIHKYEARQRIMKASGITNEQIIKGLNNKQRQAMSDYLQKNIEDRKVICS